MTSPTTLSIQEIHAAADRLNGVAVRTPMLQSSLIDERVGARVLFKPECLQRTGSFKFRGAYNAIALIEPADAENGVVAFSSGNHAQGVAAAATARGISAKIVMPADAPDIKIRNTRAYGGEVVTYDRRTEDREAIAEEIANNEGRYVIPPYDFLPVMAGQGTAGLEAADDLDQMGLSPNCVICPTGGGGLMAGFSTVMRARYPNARVYSAEPAHYDDTKRSLETGVVQRADISVPSPCDALLAPSPGKLTFPINSQNLAGGYAVGNDWVFEAMRVLFSDLKLVVEPGGAVGLAALLSGDARVEPDDTIVVVLSGGNVDPALFRDVLAG